MMRTQCEAEAETETETETELAVKKGSKEMPKIKEFAERMHVARMGDGYHVLEIPAPNGGAFKAWPGPFESELAAKLYLEELLDAYAAGEPRAACCSSGIFESFNVRARILGFLEAHNDPSDLRRLAADLETTRPWSTPDWRDLPF